MAVNRDAAGRRAAVHRKHIKRQLTQPGTSTEDCWYCQKARAVCKTKIQWHNLGDALDAAESLNIDRGWKGRVVLAYWCPWCQEWHTRTAKGTYDLRRVERFRRKHLVKTLLR